MTLLNWNVPHDRHGSRNAGSWPGVVVIAVLMLHLSLQPETVHSLPLTENILGDESEHRCQPITVESCKDVPYKLTWAKDLDRGILGQVRRDSVLFAIWFLAGFLGVNFSLIFRQGLWQINWFSAFYVVQGGHSWSFDCLIDWLIDCLLDCLIACSIDWLISCSSILSTFEFYFSENYVWWMLLGYSHLIKLPLQKR